MLIIQKPDWRLSTDLLWGGKDKEKEEEGKKAQPLVGFESMIFYAIAPKACALPLRYNPCQCCDCYIWTLLFRPTLEESQVRFVMSGGHFEQSHNDRSIRFLVHEMSGRFGRSTTFSDEMVSNLELDNLDIHFDKNELNLSASGESLVA